MVKEYTPQMMHNVFAHHPLTETQPDPKQWATTLWPTPRSFIVQHDFLGYGIFL